MSGNLNKQYIENYVIRFVSGKVDEAEAAKILRALLNYSREEWKKLLTIGKQLIEERIEKITPLVELGLSEEQKAYKDEALNFIKAGVNFSFAIFNENVFYKVAQLGKQKNLTPEQKMIKILTVIFPEVQKITSQSPKVADYHKVEVSSVAKYKKFKELGGYQSKLPEFFKIVQSLTPEEIIVLKKKVKTSIITFAKKELANQIMPEAFKKLLGSEQITKTLLDVFDVIADEKLIKKFIDFGAKFNKKLAEDPQKYKPLTPFGKFKEMGLVEELKGLMRGLTNHLNKLASKVSQYKDVSSTESERMLEKLSDDIKNEVGQNTPPPVPADQNFDGIVSSIEEIFSAIGTSDKSEFFKNIDKSLSNEQSKGEGEWYKDPLKISLLVVGIFLIGGLAGWLFFRRKNNQANYD